MQLDNLLKYFMHHILIVVGLVFMEGEKMGKLNDLIEELDNAEAEIINTEMLFVKRTRGKYVTYSPNMTAELRNELVNLIKNNLRVKSDSLRFESVFDPCKPGKDTFYFCNHNYVGSYDELMLSLNNPLEDFNTDNTGALSFYSFFLHIKIDNIEKKYYFMRRLLNYRHLQKRGFLGISSGNTYNKITSSVIGVDSYVDLICTDNDVIILSHSAVEKIFRLNEELTKKANRVLKYLEESNRIFNFERFYEDCQSVSVKRRLADLEDKKELLEVVIKNIDRIRIVIDSRKLNIEIKDNQLVYQGKEQVPDLLRILRDVFYTSEITNRKGVDE